MEECHRSVFDLKTKLNFMSPLDKVNHNKLDTSKYIYQDGIQKCQNLIEAIQWDVSLSRLDVNTAVMTLYFFRDDPRKGHIDRAGLLVSYRVKFKNSSIRIKTEEPDLSPMPITPY